jgi:nickel-dependent lactate racemase
MADITVRLLYGRQQLPVALPGTCSVHEIRKRHAPFLPDPRGAVAQALRAPVGSPPLGDLGRGRRDACVLVCDITRPVPNGLLLPPIIRELEAAGLPRERITILIATGLHRPAPEDEKRFLVGDEEVYRTVKVENHLAEDDAMHVRLGTTSRGTPVAIDRRFMEADVKIVTGLIEPHFMAGYSGGRKVIAPGVAHRDTILSFHSPPFMEDPRATNCVLEGNPLHLDQVEIVAMLGSPVFGTNVVLDEERRVIYCNAGDLLESHEDAVARARETSEVRVPRRFHTVLTSAGGFPLDKTYYQTVKGMVTPLDVLEPGGRVVIVSECSEGVGSAGFVTAQRLLRDLGPDGFVRRISDEHHGTTIDQWQTEKLVEALRKVAVYLYAPRLAREAWGDLCVHRAESAEQAVADSVAASRDPHVAVIPEGPYVIPFWEPPALT